MKRNLLFFALVPLLFGCDVPPETRYQQAQQAAATSVVVPKTNVDNRVIVTRIQVFNDTVAYGQQRGVYVIKDTESGKEFLGVSGIGITEIGRHQVGKISTQDER